jgi:Ca-activated chloride channel family protein
MGGTANHMGDMWMLRGEGDTWHRQLEAPSDSVSALDLKAPGAARHEYDKGLQFVAQNKFDGAVEHLTKAIAIYPSFVAAHNALGLAYMHLGQNDQAHKEFTQALSLDDHLPYTYLNLGRSELVLQNYPAAQNAIQKAASLLPLDLPVFTALTYAEFLNHDYAGTIATAHQVHGWRKHEKAAVVHYFAAAALQAQNKLPETEQELQIFLDEDPNSPFAGNARDTMAQISDRENHPAGTAAVEVSYSAAPENSNTPPGALPSSMQRLQQKLAQQKQVMEAESGLECETCAAADSPGTLDSELTNSAIPRAEPTKLSASPWTLHSTVNEVAVFFAATDHGLAVSDLTLQEVDVRDGGKPPASVIGFRNESQLPLRLGLVIDTSTSITKEFSFEQKAAAAFLQKVASDSADEVFVVGFSSSVLLAQDFTGDETKISHSVDQLAPAGGTALWDAVKFASDKIANRREQKPVARILVVISDGDDNASSATLQQAIEAAENGEITVYTVSTRDFAGGSLTSEVADRAMKVLAARTGGAAFFPDSLGNLDRRLSDLRQVIRGRYLISYKPAQFRADGTYRSINVTAQKSSHKLRVYARRGYYANPRTAD